MLACFSDELCYLHKPNISCRVHLEQTATMIPCAHSLYANLLQEAFTLYLAVSNIAEESLEKHFSDVQDTTYFPLEFKHLSLKPSQFQDMCWKL